MLLSFLFSLAACLLFYLTSPNQRLRAKPVAFSLARPFAWLMLLIAQCLWMYFLDAKAGFFAALCVAMLLLGVIPLLPLALRKNSALERGDL